MRSGRRTTDATFSSPFTGSPRRDEMPLPTPTLADRRFQDIVDESKRLIPQYCRKWTAHSLSDPGVALIELFAWMTEMILCRMNQVPDLHYTRFLDLMGIR